MTDNTHDNVTRPIPALVRPDLPPGVSVKLVALDDISYPKWARGKWATNYGGGHGVEGYESREEAVDCTWAAWRCPADPWVEWADRETARADAAEAEASKLREHISLLEERDAQLAEDISADARSRMADLCRGAR
jgi:hypothetical protein